MSIDSVQFIPHKLNEEEEFYGSLLTQVQRQSIENYMIGIMNKKLAEEVDAANKDQYLLNMEFYRGQITAFQYLLAVDDLAQSRQSQSSE